MHDQFKTLNTNQASYWIALGVLAVLMVTGYGAAHYMETHGHWVTGMNNQVVWGIPHVFAILLILSASGAVNVASMSSVFGQKDFSPWARLSGLLSICLLIGGLLVLVLDLGRPERLIVAMTYFNFKSIFAWNIFLYSGFILVVVTYLWTMFDGQLNRYTKKAGLLTFIWRFVLTSGTGAIFGFLVARQFYDAAMLIPLFIVLSLLLGTAIFIIVSTLVSCWAGNMIEKRLLEKLTALLGIFIATELFLVTAFHLTNLYATEHHGVELFILRGGGVYTLLFWLGQIFIGGLLPLALIFFTEFGRNISGILSIALLAITGGMAQIYVTIIGGQAYPLILFPGKEVSSSFYDGVVADYSPSLAEFLLGIGGESLALLLLLLLMRVLPFIPYSLVHKSTD